MESELTLEWDVLWGLIMFLGTIVLSFIWSILFSLVTPIIIVILCVLYLRSDKPKTNMKVLFAQLLIGISVAASIWYGYMITM